MYIYDKACLVSCFGTECLNFEKALIISYQETRQIPSQPGFTFQTIPDCTRYVIGVFCCNFKSE